MDVTEQHQNKYSLSNIPQCHSFIFQVWFQCVVMYLSTDTSFFQQALLDAGPTYGLPVAAVDVDVLPKAA